MPFPFFGNNAAKQTPNPAQQGGHPVGTGNPMDDATGNMQQHGNMQQGVMQNSAAAGAPPAPMESYSKLWESDATKPANAPKGVLPEITAEQLTTTLANSNFLSNVAPELLQKAATGDTQAFSDVINQGLRTVMTQSILASRGLVEAGTKNHGEQLRGMLPNLVRSNNVANYENNPLFKHPAVKPMVDSVRQQLESKNPTASAKEIADMTDSYFREFVTAVGGAAPEGKGGQTQGSSNKAQNGTDWFEMLGLSK